MKRLAIPILLALSLAACGELRVVKATVTRSSTPPSCVAVSREAIENHAELISDLHQLAHVAIKAVDDWGLAAGWNLTQLRAEAEKITAAMSFADRAGVTRENALARQMIADAHACDGS